jgi:hypothetical protein
MFSDEAQRVRAVRALLARIGLASLWTDEGPTPLAMKYRARSPLSSGETVMVQAAWDVWNGEGKLLLADVLDALDLPNTSALCGLVVAEKVGGPAIEQWIAEQEREREDGR